MVFTQYAGEEIAPEMPPAYDNIATPVRYAPLHGPVWWLMTTRW